MNYHPQRFIRAIAALMIPSYALLSCTSSYANAPDSAKVANIIGPNDLNVRRGGQLEPVGINTVLRKGQQLFMSGSNRTFAQLDFYNRSNQHMRIAVQTSTKNKQSTLYYFPCTVLNGDSVIIEWLIEKTTRRGCEQGIRIRAGERLSSNTQLPKLSQTYTIAALKQIFLGQASRSRFQNYCTVLADSGVGWLGVKSSGDPCKEPLQQCQATGGINCAAVTLDNWIVREENLTAIVACADNQEFKAKGAGSKMKEVATTLWEESEAQGATFCALRVVGAKDVIASPLPSGEETVVEVRNTDVCPTIYVDSGAITARSAKIPEGISVKKGEKYIYCEEDGEDKIETFDTNNESIELQVFRASERGYQICDREQASGGQEGDRRTIQLTKTQGKLRISYDMLDVPDRLQVVYEGRNLIDTDFVSGRNTLSVPFKGNSGQVEVIVTGNKEISTTEWNYTLYCPL
ncbi:MAG: hypothetical protein F6K21_17150, partial [Symploca sp. SIO2D2]|nr:hypothetical protein [Symploca sp. SIO2D2]